MGRAGTLLVGHIGKLVKLAGGMMNTHSRFGYCRMEILAAHTALQEPSSAPLIRRLLACATTEQALDILSENGLHTAVMQSVLGAVEREIQHRMLGKLDVGIILFSNQHGLLAQSGNIPDLQRIFQRKKEDAT